jgi:catechol 2,3-dioxygenase-like lactoylglutathione lyase family enzyme
VPVTDQDRAAAFYTEYLGFRVIEDQQMGPDMRWVQLGCDGQQATITLTTWFDVMTPGTVQGLLVDVDDADGTRSKMAAAGIECSELDEQPWGRFFTTKDPDGNGVIVARTTSAHS